MSGRVLIVENESWRAIDASRQDQVETCLRMVVGARVGHTPSLQDALASLGRAGSPPAAGPGRIPAATQLVFVFPVVLPREETRAVALARALEKAMPFARPFGLALLLLGAKGFSPDSLLDSFWVDVLDGYYDIAIPTEVVAWGGGPSAVESFQLAACTSSLFRELDSLEELGRLGTLLSELETRVGEVETLRRPIRDESRE